MNKILLVGKLREVYHLVAYSLIAFAAFGLSSHAYADLVLTLESEVVTSQEKNGGDDLPKTQYGEWIVRLGGDYLHFVGSEELIYDFNQKVIYSINRDTNTYDEASLYAPIGFKDIEIRNREYMIGALTAAGATDIPMSLGFSEHALSVLSKDANTDISQQQQNDETVFSLENKPMLKTAGSSINISKQYQAEFLRFFRHQFGGHPSIVGEILTPTGIYQDITIWHSRILDKQIHLRIKSIEEMPSRDYVNSLASLEKSIQTKEARLSALIERLGANPAIKRQQIEKSVLNNAARLIKANNLEGAMLAYLEHMLITGQSTLSWSEAEQTLLLNSEKVTSMLQAGQNPNNREAAESAVENLEAIRNKQSAGAHILKIFEANTRAKLRQSKLAIDLMLEALAENPYIAGAWKDTGDIYFNSFETYRAWLCWDIARKINPNHPLLDSVNKLENQLLTKYPELF